MTQPRGLTAGLNMYVNRVFRGAGHEPPVPVDYYVVRAAGCSFTVTRKTAALILRDVLRWVGPKWIRFVDLSGAEVCVPTKSVEMIAECGARQRAFDRELRRRLEEEDDGTSRSAGPAR